MNKLRNLIRTTMLLASAGMSGPMVHAQGQGLHSAPVYGNPPVEPTCCYSESRIWKKTNSQSGWSVQRRSFDPYGFPERESYQAARPTPLPRDTQLDNPWTMQGGATARQRLYSRNPSVNGSNADYFQPAPWHYPPPATTAYGAGYGSMAEAELEPLGFTGPVDPYLGGLWYPGLVGPGILNPMWPVAPYGPGIW